MADRALLDLFATLVEVADDSDAEQLQVLPVVHDALAADHEAIGALCTRYGGHYVRSDGAAGARGPVNAPMAELVTEACEAESQTVTITEVDGRVVAKAPDFGQETGALSTLLRVVEILCSSEIAEHPLVVLSYDLDGLDSTRARLLWTLTALTIADQPPAGLAVFVPIAGGKVDVGRHCDRPLAAMRFAVRDGEFIKRGPSESLENAVREILTSLDQPIVLFLGAGASAPAGVSSGDAIRDDAISLLVGKPTGGVDLTRAFHSWVKSRERWMEGEKDLSPAQFASNLTLERVLRETFWTLGGAKRSDSPIVKRLATECASALEHVLPSRTALAGLATKLPRLVIATVNFDQLVEDGHDDYVVLKSREDFRDLRSSVAERVTDGGAPLPVLKVHGTIEDPETMVADIEDTTRGLPREVVETLDVLLGNEPLTWVWIGCSMRDVDMRAWLKQKDGTNDLREWFVDPMPGRGIYDYAHFDRRRDWAIVDYSVEQRLVTETANNFLTGLFERAEELSGHA